MIEPDTKRNCYVYFLSLLCGNMTHLTLKLLSEFTISCIWNSLQC